MELWPEFNHKAALMRAYHAADKNKDGFVTRKECGNDTYICKPQTTQTTNLGVVSMILITNIYILYGDIVRRWFAVGHPVF